MSAALDTRPASVIRAEARPYRLPFARPITTAQGRFDARTGWWIALHDSAGRVAWGEVAPWPGFGVGPAAAEADLPAALRALTGQPVTAPAPGQGAVAAGIALALAGLQAQAAGLSLGRWLHPRATDGVFTHTLVTDASALAARASAAPLKLKVGAGPLADDVAQVRAVRAARPHAALRLDANGAWTPAEAERALAALAAFAPEWVEQPVPRDTPAAVWRALRQIAPVGADESVGDAAQLQALLAADAVDVVVLKPMFLGGPRATVALGRAARAAGVRICVTHALGSALERWAAVHVACALAADGPVSAGLAGGPATPGRPGPSADEAGWIALDHARPGVEGGPA